MPNEAPLLQSQSPIVNGQSPVFRSWLVLLGTLVVCLPPLLINLGDRVSTHTMENVALVASQETWLRLHAGDERARWMGFNDAIPRVEKPPLLTWLNMLAWADLDPATATPLQLTHRARLVSVAAGILMLGSIFWIGSTLFSLRVAVLATLAAGSMFFFQRQARTASYDIHFAAWATLAIAAALWAINPTSAPTTRRRQLTGWAISSVAMACSTMSKNPLAFVVVLPPVLTAIFIARQPRTPLVIGLIGSIVVALAPIGAWYWHVAEAYPGALRTWRREASQPRPGDFQPVYYYFGLAALVLPWTPWLVAALIEACRRVWRNHRRDATIALIWFAAIFIVLSIPPAKQQRYILPIIPAAALLIGEFWTRQQRGAELGLSQRWLRPVGHVMAGSYLVIGIAMFFFLTSQQTLVDLSRGVLPHPIIEPVGWPQAALTCCILVAAAVAVWRAHSNWRLTAAALGTAGWTLVLTTLVWASYHGAPDRIVEVEGFQRQAERIRAAVGEAPLYTMRPAKRRGFRRINEEFRFYFGRLIDPITPKTLAELASQSSRGMFVLARPDEKHDAALTEAGLSRVDHVQADHDQVFDLWMRSGPANGKQ